MSAARMMLCVIVQLRFFFIYFFIFDFKKRPGSPATREWVHTHTHSDVVHTNVKRI